MRYAKGFAGFAIGGVFVVSMVMAIQIYVGGYTYRNTPPLGNLIFGVVIFTPYVLSASVGYVAGLSLFGRMPAFASSLLVGASFVIAVGASYWALDVKLFHHSMIAHSVILFALAIPCAVLSNLLTRSHETPAS